MRAMRRPTINAPGLQAGRLPVPVPRARIARPPGRRGRAASTPPSPPWIDRRTRLSPAEFRRDYLLPRRPVVVTEAISGWPALKVFTPDFFRQNFADARVHIRGRACRLGEVLDLQAASTAANPGPYPCTLAGSPELLPYITPRFAASLPSRHASRLLPRRVFELVNHLEIFFGGAGSSFPTVHYDMLRMHAWVAQVYGEKEFTLYEQGQEYLLYVHRQLPWLSAVRDPEDRERWPRLRHARCHKVLLRPGDALFIPCGTWHTARCVTINITVAFDQLEASNWHEFIGEAVAEARRSGRRLGALALGAWLRAIGPLLSFAESCGAHRRRDWDPS